MQGLCVVTQLQIHNKSNSKACQQPSCLSLFASKQLISALVILFRITLLRGGDGKRVPWPWEISRKGDVARCKYLSVYCWEKGQADLFPFMKMLFESYLWMRPGLYSQLMWNVTHTQKGQIPNRSGERLNVLVVPFTAIHHFNWFWNQKLWQHLWWESNFIIHKLWKSDHSLHWASVHIPLWSGYKGGIAHSMLITQAVHEGCCSWMVDTGHLERRYSALVLLRTTCPWLMFLWPSLLPAFLRTHMASWPANPMASPPSSNDYPSISPQHLLSSCHNLE